MYVFDTNTLSAIFRHYYRSRFPSFWDKFEELIIQNEVISVREVYLEIKELRRGDNLSKWISDNEHFFEKPTIEELNFITEIYRIKHFQQNLTKKKMIQGGPFADPFIIAKARVNEAKVVTLEEFKPNAAKIPNICQRFSIDCINLEEFLTEQGLVF